jgi:hypothetical protein
MLVIKVKKGIAEGVVSKGVVYYKDEEDKQRRKEVIASPVRVKLRRLRRDTIIISLSLTNVSASLSFVQICCSSS